MLDKIKEYINYIIILIITILFLVFHINTRKQIDHYKEDLNKLGMELKTLEKNKIKVIEESLNDIRRRSEELKNGNQRLEKQLQRLNDLSSTESCLNTTVDDDIIKLLRDADI